MGSITMKFKEIIKKLLYPNKCTSDAYIAFLRHGGVHIGEGTIFYNPMNTLVDETSMPFIEIGKNCRITSGVTILAHDYSYAVLRPVYHRMLCKSGITKIGNNVFVGMHAIILMGSQIGNNVIIGAGAVVSGTVPDNVVVAGNPAKVVCTLEEHYQRLNAHFEDYARIYYTRKKLFLKRELTEKDMHWYNQLWEYSSKKEIYSSIKVDGDSVSEIVEDMMHVEPVYKSVEEFKKS